MKNLNKFDIFYFFLKKIIFLFKNQRDEKPHKTYFLFTKKI